MKHKRIIALLCAALLLLTTACSDEITAAPLADGVVFTVAVAQTPDTLNPYLSEGGLTEELFLLCYDPLWRIDENGAVQPCLAEDWSLSSDSLTWTIRLRHGVTFSDGFPLTSADVAYSYELLRRSPLYAEYFDGISAIRCPDDYTVVISTDYVKADMCLNPAPILPRHIWAGEEPSAFENAAMVGSGPFVLQPDESGEAGWMLRARKEHFEQTPVVGAVFFACYGTITGAARALAAGEADACFGLTDVQLTTLESVPGVQLVQALLPTAVCQGIVYNTRSRWFSGPTARQAVEYCLDRDWFMLKSAGGTGRTGSSFVSPGADFFAMPSSQRGYDTTTALSLFVTAGYTDKDRDGHLEYRDGSEAVMIIYTSGDDEWSSTAATIFSADLTELGIEVVWKKTDQSILDVCTEKAEWDLCFTGWRGNNDAPMTAERFYDYIGELSGWRSDEYYNTLTQLRSAQDEFTLRSLAARLQQLVFEECPAAVLGYGSDIQAIRHDDWTGYEALLNGEGGLFATGSAAAYMMIRPAEPADKPA